MNQLPNKKLSIYNSETLSTIIQSLATPVFVKSQNHQWILVNQAFCDFIGHKEDQLIGKSDYDFFPKEEADVFWEKDNQVFITRQGNINEEQITVSEGDVRFIETKKIVFYDEVYGDVLCGVITDITKIKQYQNQLDEANTVLTNKVRQRAFELENLNRKLEVMAYTDQLTGLMNRAAIDSLAYEAIEQGGMNHSKVAFLFLDMDGLKFVNDSYGHPIGDMLIKKAAVRLTQIVGEAGHLARIGGDEFLIMQPYEDMIEIQTLAEEITLQMQKPARLINKLLPLSSSLGVACFPDHGEDWVSLFQNADCAMYAAKNNKKGSFEIYQHQFTADTVRKLELENELRNALENKEIDVLFQPILETNTQKLCGYEALARWESKSFGHVSPDEFIQIAELSDTIIVLGEVVIEKALNFINKNCKNEEYVSINVSPKQLHHGGFEHRLTELLNYYEVQPFQLALEVTESVLTEVSNNLTNVSNSMALQGIKIFVDDFGTGYSNLMQLKRLKFSTIKVDREFIKGITHSDADKSLIKSISLMANEMKLNVIAEGVETNEQRQCLVDLGIPFGQGFYWNEAKSSEYWQNFNQ